MLTASTLLPKGAFDISRASERITLAFDQRWRRRLKLISEDGLEFLLDLPQAQMLRGGDGLELSDGRVVLILAAGEDLLEVRAGACSLARLAWHLGNRHTPAALYDDRILVRRDHVLADMLKGLGADVREVVAPFDPEGGAYATATGHAHRPPHDHDHDHGHDHGDAHHHHHHGHSHNGRDHDH